MHKSQEWYAKLYFPADWSPGVFFVRDFDWGGGIYVEGSMSHRFSTCLAPLDAVLSMGYNRHHYRRRNGLSHVNLSLLMPFKVNPHVQLTPSLSLLKSLDSQDFDDRIYGGVKVSLDL